MKSSFHYVLIFVIICASCSEEQDPNPDFEGIDLVRNGSVDTPPTEWLVQGESFGYDVVWSGVEFVSPNYSISISTDESIEDNYAYWSQEYYSDIPINKEVTLKCKIKGDLNGPGISLVITTNNLDAQDLTPIQSVSTEGNVDISGAFDWDDFQVSLAQVDSTADNLNFYLIYLPGTTGEVYFDDISLTH